MIGERKVYLFWVIVTIMIGLFSRTSLALAYIPDIGDTLYGLMFFGIIGFVFPQKKSIEIALIAIGVCFLIELSQLCQADWLNQIRANRLGRLVLGYGFLWADLGYYTLGGILGYFINKTRKNYKKQ